MSQNKLKIRVQHKHDTEANWNNTINFIPEDGEIIVYKTDENNKEIRIKIGDGKTNIKELPFFKGQGNNETYTIPDWNASESENGYIKNRTHYEDREVIVPETAVETEGIFPYGQLPDLDKMLIEGQTYVINFNNKNYNCVAWKADEEKILLGNGSLLEIEGGEDVPFCFDNYYEDLSIYLNTQYAERHTVSIIIQGEIKKLDEKFIPDNLVRVDDLPVAITSERITEICGIEPVMTFAINEHGDALVGSNWPDENGNIQI